MSKYLTIFCFPLIVFDRPEAPFLYLFSSAAPQRTAYSGVPSQMAAHPRIGSPFLAGEIGGYKPRTAGLQSGVVTNKPSWLPENLKT
jgi:hypothetical protein